MGNVYEICFYGGLVLAIIFLIVSIILFIVLKIPKVIGELSGRAAKKGIKEKQQGKTPDNSVSKKEQAKYYNQNSGKITVRDTVSQETRATNQDNTTDNLGKEKVQEKKPVFTPQFDPDETAVLGATPEMDNQIAEASGDVSEAPTDVLRVDDEEATDVLASETEDADEEATDVLKSETEDADEEATDVLKSEDADEEATDVLKSPEADEEATDVLKTEVTEQVDDEATDVLTSNNAGNVQKASEKDVDDEATDVLRSCDEDDEPATDVLRGDSSEDGDSTTVLASKKTRQLAHKAKVIYNIVVVNTDEKI